MADHEYYISADDPYRGAKVSKRAKMVCVKCNEVVRVSFPMDIRAFVALAMGIDSSSECYGAIADEARSD